MPLRLSDDVPSPTSVLSPDVHTVRAVKKIWSANDSSRLPGRRSPAGQVLSQDLIDPFSGAMFRDPVVAADGFTYEREHLERWLEHAPIVSPRTRLPMTDKFVPDEATAARVRSVQELFPEATRASVPACVAAVAAGVRRLRGDRPGAASPAASPASTVPEVKWVPLASRLDGSRGGPRPRPLPPHPNEGPNEFELWSMYERAEQGRARALGELAERDSLWSAREAALLDCEEGRRERDHERDHGQRECEAALRADLLDAEHAARQSASEAKRATSALREATSQLEASERAVKERKSRAAELSAEVWPILIASDCL